MCELPESVHLSVFGSSASTTSKTFKFIYFKNSDVISSLVKNVM